MPKVLRIINRFNLGGPTYNAANLTKYMSADFETMLIGGKHESGEISSTYINDSLGIDYQVLPNLKRSIDFITDRSAYSEIKKIIGSFKPDIVHTHASKAGAIGRLAAYHSNVPVVVHTFHGHVFHGYFGKAKTQFYKSVERYLASKSNAIIAISAEQKRELTEVHRVCTPHQTHVIPLGFDLNRFRESKSEKRTAFRSKWNIPDHTFAIGIIGRFAPIKNHTFFLEIMEKLKGTNVLGILIGDGDEKESIIAKARQKGIEQNLIFTSWIKDIDAALPGLDAVILTSDNEGTPVSLIEAQASAKPVLSTNVGGVKDVVLDRKSGYILEKGDLEGFIHHIKELETSVEFCRKMGQAGEQWAFSNFTAERLAEDMKNLYLSLL